MLIADTHCDTLHAMLINNEGFNENSLQIDFATLKNSSQSGYLQFFAIFESPSNTMEQQKKDVRHMIDSYHEITSQYGIQKVLSVDDLTGGGVKSLLSIEGLYFIEGDVDALDGLYNEGVRCISLTWNPGNEFAGGVNDPKVMGLTEKGVLLVEKAFELGIALDVSHISDKGFWDIAKIAEDKNLPFIASHSNVRSICSHKRNLSDDMLKELAKAGGVSGINMFTCFLSDKCEAGPDDIIKHIEYICALTGPGHVGFGSDFDGIGLDNSAIAGPKNIGSVLERLLAMNYSENDVRAIASGNFLRVLGKVL